MTDHNDTGATAGPWSYDIQHGPNGEEIYAWVYYHNLMVCTVKVHHARLIVEAGNAYKPLKARLAEVERERDDIRSTLNAWFNTSNKLEPDISKLLLDGLNGYIRRSESGGMPFELADDLRAVIEDFCRLYVGELLTPYIEQAKSSAEARIAVLEKTLGRIAVLPECGCKPCTGQCRSQAVLLIELEEIRALARTALAAEQKEAGK